MWIVVVDKNAAIVAHKEKLTWFALCLCLPRGSNALNGLISWMSEHSQSQQDALEPGPGYRSGRRCLAVMLF